MTFREAQAMGPLDVLIFDMDGVLIDVSRSYRETIRQTVQIYLETCLGLKPGQEVLVSLEDISLLKSLGRFNNDWDLTSGLLLYLLSISGLPPRPRQKKFFTLEGVIQHLGATSSRFRLDPLRIFKRKNTPAFVKAVSRSGSGLPGIRRALSKVHGASWNGWIYRSGDLKEENVVQRIFQEVYLGDQFVRHYGLQPRFYRGPGYHLRERLLIPRQVLARLRKKVHMGIASGRPRFEADLALRRFRLSSYFDSVVTLDECKAAEARVFRSTGSRVKLTKPHPYPLLRVVREIGLPRPRCAYVGDVVDDMQAARAASRRVRMMAIGFMEDDKKSGPRMESLQKAGASRMITYPSELLLLIPGEKY